MHLLLIDGGYASHYRFYAAQQWWKRRQESVENCWDHHAFRETVMNRWRAMLQELVARHQPDRTVLCMDGRNSWRKDLYPDYKGQRTPGHAQIGAYMADLKTALPLECEALGIECYESPRVEADDWIGYLVTSREEGMRVTIVSADHDFYSLLDDNVEMVSVQGKNEVRGPTGKTALMQKILMGDKSDNIPPIFKGCGPKTAMQLASDPTLLDKKLEDPCTAERYKLNTQLIAFGHWPSDILDAMKTALAENSAGVRDTPSIA